MKLSLTPGITTIYVPQGEVEVWVAAAPNELEPRWRVAALDARSDQTVAVDIEFVSVPVTFSHPFPGRTEPAFPGVAFRTGDEGEGQAPPRARLGAGGCTGTEVPARRATDSRFGGRLTRRRAHFFCLQGCAGSASVQPQELPDGTRG